MFIAPKTITSSNAVKQQKKFDTKEKGSEYTERIFSAAINVLRLGGDHD